MNSIQIKQVLRREKSANSLSFVRHKCADFVFQCGRLKFHLFDWPPMSGFSLLIWFKSEFQIIFKGGDEIYQLAVIGNMISICGISQRLPEELTDWNFFSLIHSHSKYQIIINNAVVCSGKIKYPSTRLWDDCCLETMSGVGDFVILKQGIKDGELMTIGKEMSFLESSTKWASLIYLWLSASQVDKTESICYDASIHQHHAALEDVKISKQTSLVKVYESLGFPISLITLLPQGSDKEGNFSPVEFQKLIDKHWIFNMEIWSLTSSTVFSEYMACISDSFDSIQEWKVLFGPEFWLEAIERYFGANISSPAIESDFFSHPKKKHLFDIVTSTLKWDSLNIKNLCQFISTSLYTTLDSQYVCDVLTWIRSIMGGSDKQRELVDTLVSKNEGNLFYYLMASENEGARLLALEYILIILRNSDPVRSPSVISPLTAHLRLKKHLSSEIHLTLNLIISRIKMAKSSEETCRTLFCLAFDQPRFHSFAGVDDELELKSVEYLAILFELFPFCGHSQAELLNFCSLLTRWTRNSTFDHFWKIIDRYQSQIPMIMDLIDSKDKPSSSELIGRILFRRCITDQDLKREIILEMEYFMISAIVSGIPEKDLVFSRISKMLQAVFIDLKQNIQSNSSNNQFKFGTCFKKIMVNGHFFLMHFNDLYAFIEASSVSNSSEFVFHKQIPFESDYHLSCMFLDICGAILNLPYANQLHIRDTSIPINSFLALVERLGLDIALSGFETSTPKVWEVSISYLNDFIEKRCKKFVGEASADDIYHIYSRLYECISRNISKFEDNSDPVIKSVLHIFQEVFVKAHSKDKNNIFGEIDFSNNISNLIESWRGIYDNLLLPSSRKKEEVLIDMSKKKTNKMKNRYDKIVAQLSLQDDNIRKQSMELLVNINLKRNQLSNVWRKVLKDQVLALKQDHLDASVAGSKIISSFNCSNLLNHWRLDMYENSLRMRKRLVENKDFNDHSEASTKRDKVQMVRSNSLPLIKVIDGHSKAFLETKPSKLDRYHQFSSMRTASGDSVFSDKTADSDDWNVVQNEEISQNSSYTCDAEFICLMHGVHGKFYLNNQSLGFIQEERVDKMISNNSIAKESSFQCFLNQIDSIRCRRYKLRDSALEFFLKNGRGYLVNFHGSTGLSGKKERSLILKKISSFKIPGISFSTKKPMEIFSNSTLTEKWRTHQISNFEYLMKLNTISGRTYNDLTQYPIFPWILKDYSSSNINLKDPKVYRDLSRPIGALDEKRLQQIIERYKAFEDPTGFIKKFHYGTHYSSAASVLFYLLRLEPFTTLHIELQGGKFDYPDRQFHSLESCWNSVLTVNGDFKELIPEFFYSPEFLLNENHFDLGQRQSGDLLNDVKLPPWAKDAWDFVRINREALESDYVSENLHQWIDLIWGYKQRGEEAVRAHNVFYFLTYEDEINIDTIKDPVERRSIEDQINNFGQTPSQLLRKPHPKRLQKSETLGCSIYDSFDHHKIFNTTLNAERIFIMPFLNTESASPIKSIPDLYSGKLLGIDENLHAWVYSWRITPTKEFIFKADTRPAIDRKIPIYLPDASSKSFIPNLKYEYVIVIGCADRTFKIVSDLDKKPNIICSISGGHTNIINCAALSEDDKLLVTGSLDSNIVLWQLRSRAVVNLKFTIFTHESEITSVAISRDNDIIVSASNDGKLMLHTVIDGYLLRIFALDNLSHVKMIGISSNCDIVIVSSSLIPDGHKTCALNLYSINGKCMSTQDYGNEISDFKFSQSGSHIMILDATGSLKMHYTHDFSLIQTLIQSSEVPISSILIYPQNESFLHVARPTGKGFVQLDLISTDLVLGE